MQKILLSAISLIMLGSLVVGAPVTEKEADKPSLQKEKSARKNKDHSLVKSEAEILVEIEAKILEVDEDAFPDAYKDREGSPNVITDSQANILLNALKREEATVLLSAPRITVKNGEKATIKVGQEIPTEKVVSEAHVHSLLQQVLAKSKEEVMKILSGVDENAPLHQQLMIGFELAVTPTVQKNNQIHLQLNPKVRHFDGFVEYGGPFDPTGGIGFSKRLPSVIRMPIFSVRKTATQTTTLSDEATAIIGGLSSKKIKINDDKIPVSTESNQTRSLIMFVSAKIASAESSPDRENINKKLEELKAKKKQLNVQLDKTNKRLAEVIALMNQLNDESPKSSKVEIIGIGAKLTDVNGSCTIVELIPGGPAEKSQQLEPKDVILKVSKSDGTLADVSDMKLSEIVELIKGPKNSKVKLLIQPFKNPSTPKEVSIKRKPFHIYHQTHENKVSEKATPIPIVDANLMGFPKEIRVGETGVEWIFNANLMGIPKKIKVGKKIFVPQKKPMTK